MNKLRKIVTAMTTAILAAGLNLSAYAEAATSGGGGLSGSVAVTGTMKLLNDASNALLIIAPIAGVVCIIFFSIRHAAADEMDQKKWKQRIVVAAVSVIVAVLASAIISTLVGYYQ
ncbi:MAG: Mbov_0395 family pilin-like conjugal transfer protein [Oscillospiraceae bacterium]